MINRSYGCTRLCVREGYGAKGDGLTDDTAAIQAAIDALPVAGGEVHIPNGRYMIDTTKSLRLRSNMRLHLDPGATLIALPNTKPRDYVLLAEGVHDVEIEGGGVLGDLDSFVEQDGTTSEWGHGLAIYNSRGVSVRYTTFSHCVGDGISIGKAGTADVYLEAVVCSDNRRQGLSVVHCEGLTAVDCVFQATKGTAPQCGVDLEPEAGNLVDRIRFVNCQFRGNARYGFLALTRTAVATAGGRVGRVDLVSCVIEENASNGAVVDNCDDVHFDRCLIQRNSATGLRIESDVRGGSVQATTFFQNYTRNGLRDRTDISVTGYNKLYQADLLVLTGAVFGVGTNTYK